MSGAGVGDDLLSKPDPVDNLLVLDIQILLVNNLPPAPTIVNPAEEKDGSVALTTLHQGLPLQVIDLLHLRVF